MPGFLLALSYTALILFAMGRIPFFAQVPHLSLRWVRLLFLAKIAAGTALWAVYTYLYTDRTTADIFKYFDDSFHMYKALPGHPVDYLKMLFGYQNDTPEFLKTYYLQMNNWERHYESNLYNDAHTIIRFNAAVRLISFGEFHVHTVIAAFLSFLGSVGIYRVFVHRLPGLERPLLLVLFLLPSVLFWSSGVIKESLLFFGLGLLLHQLHRITGARQRWYDLVLALFALALLFLLKFYVLMSLVPALVFFLWSTGRTGWSAWWRAIVVFGAFALIGTNIQVILPGTDILGILTMKQRDFVGLAQQMNSGSFVMPVLLLPEVELFAAQSPYALFITFLGPLVYAGPGAMGLISAAENLAIVLVVMICLIYRRPWAKVDLPLLLALIGFVLVLALVIGWTTPVMGAVVRYRTPLLPFLLIAALCIADADRILAPWPRLRRSILPSQRS